MLVFVYGTLKRGYWNYDRFLTEAAFVGTGQTSEHFRMRDVGFPMIFPSMIGMPVRGEVFDVDRDTLVELDRLEGEGRMYDRRLSLVTMDDGRTEMCMIYVGVRDYREGDPVASAEGVLTWSPSR